MSATSRHLHRCVFRYSIEYNQTHAWCIEIWIESSLHVGRLNPFIRLPILLMLVDLVHFHKCSSHLPVMFRRWQFNKGKFKSDSEWDPSSIDNGNITASGLFQYAFGSDDSLDLAITARSLMTIAIVTFGFGPRYPWIDQHVRCRSSISANQGQRSMLIFVTFLNLNGTPLRSIWILLLASMSCL